MIVFKYQNSYTMIKDSPRAITIWWTGLQRLQLLETSTAPMLYIQAIASAPHLMLQKKCLSKVLSNKQTIWQLWYVANLIQAAVVKKLFNFLNKKNYDVPINILIVGITKCQSIISMYKKIQNSKRITAHKKNIYKMHFNKVQS